jgi:hypothetical protein
MREVSILLWVARYPFKPVDMQHLGQRVLCQANVRILETARAPVK